MRRMLWILAAAVLSAVALFALLVALLPREALKTRIGEQLAAWTGREVSLRGEPEIDFFPRLTVTLNDVEVDGPAGMTDAQIVSMDRLTGSIRFLPLIIGRVEIDSFTMVHPLIRLVRDQSGTRNWDFDTGAAALQLAFAGDVPLGDFVLQNGTVIYEDRKTGATERLDSVNLSVNWASVRQPLFISGTGVWRGEHVTFSGSADAPFTFMNGGATPVEAQLEAAAITLLFAGEADEYPTPRLAGGLKMSTASLRRFAAWLGIPIGPGSTLGPASLFGTAVFDNRVLSVENAEVMLDGNSASGALEVTATAKPNVTGTLAFTSLNLTPYFVGLISAFRTTGDWRQISFDTDWFRDLSADIRLSAGSVQLGELSSGDTAASVLLRDARLEIGVARAVFNGGSLAGDLAIMDATDLPGATFEAQLRATDFDLEQAVLLLGLPRNISGTASAAVDVAAKGAALGGLVRDLGGTVGLDVRSGAVPLFGLAELAAAAGDALPQQALDGLVARPVTSVSARLSFSGGVSVVEFANVRAPTFTADARGWIGMLDGRLGLTGTIHPSSSGDAPGEGRPFAIEGTLRFPVARPLALAEEPQPSP